MRRSLGLTLIEALIVISLLAIFFSLGTIVFNNFARRDQIETASRKIVACLVEARSKTLAGYSKGQASSLNFGVHFETSSYSLFSGLSFNSSDVTNQNYNLSSSLAISQISLPIPEISFEKITGEVRNFNPSQNFIIITDQKSNQQRKISINKLGVAKVE